MRPQTGKLLLKPLLCAWDRGGARTIYWDVKQQFGDPTEKVGLARRVVVLELWKKVQELKKGQEVAA